ncbi:T9SS type A sorting domain-containing protein [Flavivirga jejuensis]|uniref:T9SS type A sorting domain-containing protein n=1 Tax=Flavivirga jejuensis TaxID=870487 RepID=A0ABT8WQE3_9FLAO|nr:T9SS type A sorting domain-containing protein [Flavivirga jejuensis]MDO5975393.1 T9SS type A sorting domain-containing protein [Flavivirga jejuensis]
MMKKITLLLILLTASLGYAQSSPINFESDVTTGVNWIDAGVDVAIEDDATPTAPANGKVGRLLTKAGGQPWQEAHLTMTTSAIDLTTATGGAKTVSVDVYSTTGNDFLLKVIDGISGAGASEVPAAHNGTGWETLEFNFNNATVGGVPNGEYKTFAFFPLYDISGGLPGGFIGMENNSPVTTTFIDNVTFVEGTSLPIESCDDGIKNQDEDDIDCGGVCSACTEPAVPPTTAPNAPPARLAADVISIYGDAYGTPIGVANVPWDDSDFTVENIASNDVLKIDFGNFLGMSLGASVDASAMTHFHMDFWISDAFVAGQVFNPKWSNHAGGGVETDAFELTVAIGPTDVQTWVSIDVPLTNFANVKGSGVTARAELLEFLLTVSGTLDVGYLDNIYLHKNTSLSAEENDIARFKTYPNPTQDSWTVETKNESISSIRVFDILGKNVLSVTPNKSKATVDGSSLKSGLYFAQIKTANGISSLKLVKK